MGGLPPNKALPKGPRGHGLFGNLGDFNRDQLGFYARCAREHGDVVPVRLGPSRGLLIYHPDAIEEVLVARNRDFIKSRGIRLLRELIGNGLFVSDNTCCRVTVFRHPRLSRMAAFLVSIGIEMRAGTVDAPTVSPGSLVSRGSLVVTSRCASHPATRCTRPHTSRSR